METSAPPARRIGIVGAGLMGSEIAFVAAAAGLEVRLRDADPGALRAAHQRVADIGRRRIARGRLTEEAGAALLERVRLCDRDAGLAGCDLVVEAVSEVMVVKRAVFLALDAVLEPDALIASNTSGLSITEMAQATGRPERVLGLHFFNPASVMALVEVIAGADTARATLERATATVTAMGKTPVSVRECPGFLVNRILVRAMLAGIRHAEGLGAEPAAVDAAVVADGPAPMGPFALADLVGLDTLRHLATDLERAYGDRFASGRRLGELVGAGHLGRKSGGGFYARPPAETRPDEPGHRCAERYYAAARDEAELCRAEAVAAPGDIDLAIRLGAGWEAGPLEAGPR